MSIEKAHRLITYSQTVPVSVLKLLVNTYIGTNGTQYRLKSTEEKIDQLSNPHFFYLERGENAIANVTLCERSIVLYSQTIRGFYIRYFAFDLIFQSNQPNSKGQSSFHDYFRAIFDSSNLNALEPKFDKSIHWAYIDPENTRSSAMKEHFGFTSLGQFETFSFSRIKPKRTANVERLAVNDRPIVQHELNQFYEDYNFFSPVHIFENDNYFVLKKSGEIIAGIQVNPVEWEVKNLPGFFGKLMIKLGPVIPGLRKLFNPKNHKFLATEGIFWKSGYEQNVAQLLEGVLHLTQHHSMLIWEDTNSHYIKGLPLKWGLIERLKKSTYIDIVAKCNGFNDHEIKRMKNSKKYISGFDVT